MGTTIGILMYPRMTQLDMTGPFEVLARLPESRVELVAATMEPVASDTGLRILPTTTLDDCPALDVLLVPGGPGQSDHMEDAQILTFLREQAAKARFLCGVCTGALLFGAAGLLRGRRATTHWSAIDQLELFGAEAVEERVVRDGDLFTGGGVTAGIDVALRLAAELAGELVAQGIELGIEYHPAPPFGVGHPSIAPQSLVDSLRAMRSASWDARVEASARAAAALREED